MVSVTCLPLAIKAHPTPFKVCCAVPLVCISCSLSPECFSSFLSSRQYPSLGFWPLASGAEIVSFPYCPVGPDLPYFNPALTLLLPFLLCLAKVVENTAQLICNVISAGCWHSTRHITVTQQIHERTFNSEKSERPMMLLSLV